MLKILYLKNIKAEIISPTMQTKTVGIIVSLVNSSTLTPVKFAIQTLCVLVGSQTFWTWTTHIIAASKAIAGKTPMPNIIVNSPMPMPKIFNGPRYNANGDSNPKNAT